MADLEAVLREKTYKEQGMEPERRIYYTLTDKETPGLTEHRTAKLLALTIAMLMERGIVLPRDLDDMLLELLG